MKIPAVRSEFVIHLQRHPVGIRVGGIVRPVIGVFSEQQEVLSDLLREDEIHFVAVIPATTVIVEFVIEQIQFDPGRERCARRHINILKTVGGSHEEFVGKTVPLVIGGQGEIVADSVVGTETLIADPEIEIFGRGGADRSVDVVGFVIQGLSKASV